MTRLEEWANKHYSNQPPMLIYANNIGRDIKFILNLGDEPIRRLIHGRPFVLFRISLLEDDAEYLLSVNTESDMYAKILKCIKEGHTVMVLHVGKGNRGNMWMSVRTPEEPLEARLGERSMYDTEPGPDDR